MKKNFLQMIKRIGRKVDWFISNFSKINYLQILGSNKGGRTMDTGVVRRMGEQRIGRGLGESWRIKRYGYFGISAAIRDHSMLPFQCFAPPSVKVAKIRRGGVSFARVAAEESPAIIPRWLETGNRDVTSILSELVPQNRQKSRERTIFRYLFLENAE